MRKASCQNNFSELNESQLLHSIKRGVTSYISYLASCSMSEVYSEYLLYEPILRILNSKHCIVRCEFPCKGLSQKKRGDEKRIDFMVKRNNNYYAIEVKWADTDRFSIENDKEKLIWFKKNNDSSKAFLVIFGKIVNLKGIKITADENCKNRKLSNFISNKFREKGKPIYADFGKTKYGCRIFEVID